MLLYRVHLCVFTGRLRDVLRLWPCRWRSSAWVLQAIHAIVGCGAVGRHRMERGRGFRAIGYGVDVHAYFDLHALRSRDCLGLSERSRAL